MFAKQKTHRSLFRTKNAYVKHMFFRLWTLPPPPVYLGRYWQHSHDKMDLAFPLHLCAYCKWSKTGRWEGLGTRLVTKCAASAWVKSIHVHTPHELQLTSSVTYNDPHSVAGSVGVSQKCSESAADFAAKKHDKYSGHKVHTIVLL